MPREVRTGHVGTGYGEVRPLGGEGVGVGGEGTEVVVPGTLAVTANFPTTK